MKREQKARFLSLLKSGYDLEAACSKLNIPPKTVRGDAALMSEVSEAYAIGTSRLRAKLLELALHSDDTRTLAQLLAAREATQATLSRVETGFDDAGLAVLRTELLREVERHALAMKIPENPLELLSDEALERVERACMSPEDLATHEAVGREREERWADQAAENHRQRPQQFEDLVVDYPAIPVPRSRALKCPPGPRPAGEAGRGEAGALPRGAGWRNRGGSA